LVKPLVLVTKETVPDPEARASHPHEVEESNKA